MAVIFHLLVRKIAGQDAQVAAKPVHAGNEGARSPGASGSAAQLLPPIAALNVGCTLNRFGYQAPRGAVNYVAGSRSRLAAPWLILC